MINEKIEKVKNYVKEHKEDIKLLATMLVVGLGSYAWGVVVGRKTVNVDKDDFIVKAKDNNGLYRLLNDVNHRYGDNMVGTYTGISTGAYKPEDLGKLGENMINAGVDENMGFTHFMAVTNLDENN